MNDARASAPARAISAWDDAAPAAPQPALYGGRIALQSGLPLVSDGREPRTARRTVRRQVQLAGKRLMDLALGTMLLVFFTPLMAALALAVGLTTPGPVLLTQTRVGKGGKPIGVIKFRTMHADRCDDAGLCQAAPDDPRITPVGRFMRRNSLDELPQLINVLCGDMALVGPRPHTPGIKAAGMPYERLVPYYAMRQELKPGMTGWAQANGLRGPTGDAARARARIDHDLAYIQNFSLLLDIRILFLTLRREFFGGSGS